jgi:hypothetical protein
MSCEIFVQLFKCEILIWANFIASCTLCIAEVESVETEGVIRLTGGRPPCRQPSWTSGGQVRNNREDDDGFEYFKN